MKKQNLKLISITLICSLNMSMYAGEIILDPSKMIPSDTGFYIGGAWSDENHDGVTEFYNGCNDGWENDQSHRETGTQQGFTYINCMIMPDCGSKSTQLDPPVQSGFIQLNWSFNLYTDSAKIGAVISPAFTNLTSIFMETSSDVSVNSKRSIPYNIEFSKDNGKTWEPNYILDHVANQGGYRVTYTDDGLFPSFTDFKTASQTGPIVIRIYTNDHNVLGSENGQYVNIHKLTITADLVVTSIAKLINKTIEFSQEGRTLVSKSGSIKVTNVMGQFIGKGITVKVPASGIYMLQSTDNVINKVFIK